MRLPLSGRVGIYCILCAFVLGAGFLYYADPDRPYLGFSGSRITLVPFLVLSGVVLLLRSLIVQWSEERDAGLRTASLTSPESPALPGFAAREGRGVEGCQQWQWTFPSGNADREICLEQVLLQTRAFGMIASTTLLVILAPCWLFHARLQRNSVGLRVFLLRASKDFTISDALGDALVVRVDAHGQCSLNGKDVSRTELVSRLKKALRLRAGKVVFVDGEDRNSWASIVEVIDSIQGACDAKIVLLGRESRARLSPRVATRPPSQPIRN